MYVWISDRRGEEEIEKREYHYIPTDEGTSLNKSLEYKTLPLEQIYNVDASSLGEEKAVLLNTQKGVGSRKRGEVGEGVQGGGGGGREGRRGREGKEGEGGEGGGGRGRRGREGGGEGGGGEREGSLQLHESNLLIPQTHCEHIGTIHCHRL